MSDTLWYQCRNSEGWKPDHHPLVSPSTVELGSLTSFAMSTRCGTQSIHIDTGRPGWTVVHGIPCHLSTRSTGAVMSFNIR